MIKIQPILLSFLFLFSLCSCQAKHDPMPGAQSSNLSLVSCVVSHGSVCNEASSSVMTASSCAIIEGTFAAAPCPSENRVGQCSVPMGILTGGTSYYSIGDIPWTTSGAQQNCSLFSNGTFTSQ